MAPPADLNRTTTVNRPKYREMVKVAITTLAEKKGSSRQAIMKYIMGTYGITEDGRSKALIRTALVEGVKNGYLTQTKGTGASGSFKLGKKAAEPKAKKLKAKKEAPKVQKESKKPVAKETKAKSEKKPKPRKNAEKDPKSPKKKVVAKMAKPKKPPNALKSPKAVKVKVEKPVQSPKSPKPTLLQHSTSPLKALTKLKAKLLFTSTPSKKKKGRVTKLLTPKRVVVKTKQTVKKSQKKKKPAKS